MSERSAGIGLSTVDWYDAGVALPHVLVVAAMVRLFGLKRTATALLRGGAPSPARSWSDADVALWVRRTVAVRRVAGRLPDTACLVRSIALAWWMRRHGLAAEVAAGIPAGAHRGAPATGHAWVEFGGHRFDDPADAPDRFVPIDLGVLLAPVAAPGAATQAPRNGARNRAP